MNKENEIKPLIIIGAGGQAANIANIVIDSGIVIDSFVDEIYNKKEYLGYKIYNSFDVIKDLNKFNFAIAIGDNFKRQQLHLRISKKFPDINFPFIKHPSSVVSKSALLGKGVILMPNTIVGANSKIGDFCVLDNQSCLGHDSVMQNFSRLGPGSVTGGSVTIGVRSMIAMNSSIKQGIKVEDDCVLGASSYLDKNLPKNIVAYGTPAIKIRDRANEDSYL
jgi:sugar O-acyltransferase (sialic acid O-acetyltransferase NeuD family)